MKIAVVGTVFVDCKGFAQQQYVPTGRNVGEVRFFHGGVGRNVAENLLRIGLDTALVSTVDDSGIGSEVQQRLGEAGMDLTYLYAVPERGMGMWLAVLNEHGDLMGSISQMPDMAVLEEKMDAAAAALVEDVSHIALELDLTAGISRKILDAANAKGVPVYGIPGNLTVIMANPDLLPRLDCFICNDIEGGRLLGVELTRMEPGAILAALQNYIATLKIPSMVVTLGERGSVYVDSRSDEAGFQPVFPVQVVDTTGAGDAFFSGTVAALTRGKPLREAVMEGTRIAGWTIESAENTCPDLAERLKGIR